MIRLMKHNYTVS